MKIKCAIVGYGNIGKSVEKLVVKNSEYELVGIFSRRDKSKLFSPFSTEFFEQNTLLDDRFCGLIDVVFLCVGSAFDLERTAYRIATRFSTVDTFDTHAKMKEYVEALDLQNKMFGTLSLVGCGWDPGLFSLERALTYAVMPRSNPQTFWGKGVSQGHSEAIRKIYGVKYATQYTVPKVQAIERARQGESEFSTREKHERVCFVVPNYGVLGENATNEQKLALEKEIKEQIVTMPNYFADYDTTVNFVDEDEYFAHHTKMSHAGQVIAVERENGANKNFAEFSLALDSNPDFTAQVMVAYARACCTMKNLGETGARTILDVPIKYLLPEGVDSLSFV